MSLWLLLAGLFASGYSQLQEPLQLTRNKVIDDALYSYVLSEMQAGKAAGVSLAIVWANGEVEYETWGKRDEHEVPVTTDVRPDIPLVRSDQSPQTMFNLGSCSKAFLSASLGILMDDFSNGENATSLPDRVSEFNWNSKLIDLLPGEWALEDEWATNNTDLKDLLSHRTGVPAHDGSYSPYESPSDIVAKLRHLRSSDELRQRYQYNNMMYVTGAHIVSKYSGLDYRDFVEERIFKPLGMKSSTLYPDRAAETGRLTQAWTPLAGGRRIPFFMPEHSAPLIAGAGGVQSTTEDMAAYVRTLLNQGVDPRTNKTIIPKSTFDLATSAITVAVETGTESTSIMGYGLGWGRLSYRGHDVVTHNGGAPGVATRVEFYPQDGVGIVVLINTAVQDTLRNISRKVMDRVLGLPPRKNNPTTKDPPHPPKAVEVAKPMLGFEGSYANPGYGNFTLCSPIFSGSSACKAVVHDFLTVDIPSGKFPR
ncbi:Beta-lactamase domain-containing protein [Mycena indigotica]|uniref:Beta-lactamase domain-containing protein n=1 Tax=Mycena indigotica TaxID=2126181 RepID=A0A8H6TD13_9AGAR|nr:Beta-lactamase domain-containing protein [Mycena indigotica]KAF7316348.1 Beta-lactamase domain-containing protein [Mycena indigotica]